MICVLLIWIIFLHTVVTVFHSPLESSRMKTSSSLEWNLSSKSFSTERRKQRSALHPLKCENDWLGATPFGLWGCREANSLKCWGSALFSCLASWKAQLPAGIQRKITTNTFLSKKIRSLLMVPIIIGEKVLRPLGNTATWRCWCVVFVKRLLRYGWRIWRVLYSTDSCNKSSRERSQRRSSEVL